MRPGRKRGHRGSYRPWPKRVDESIDVPLDFCPRCLGPIGDVRRVEQFIEKIPPVRPDVTRLVTYKGSCPKCGIVHSEHPLRVSRAVGAAHALGSECPERGVGPEPATRPDETEDLRRACRFIRPAPHARGPRLGDAPLGVASER